MNAIPHFPSSSATSPRADVDGRQSLSSSREAAGHFYSRASFQAFSISALTGVGLYITTIDANLGPATGTILAVCAGGAVVFLATALVLRAMGK